MEYSEYLFSWDEVPGNDSEKCIDFLKQKFGINWIEIEKIDNNTITVSTGNNSLSLTLNPEKTKVKLEIDDGRNAEFMAKRRNSKLNIYNSDIVVNQLDQFFKTNIEMQICRDICNESKHCSLENPSIGVKIPNTNKKSAEGLAGVCIVKEYDPFQKVLKNTNPIKNIKYVVLAGGKKYDVFELADKCLKLWEDFFQENDLADK